MRNLNGTLARFRLFFFNRGYPCSVNPIGPLHQKWQLGMVKKPVPNASGTVLTGPKQGVANFFGTVLIVLVCNN